MAATNSTVINCTISTLDQCGDSWGVRLQQPLIIGLIVAGAVLLGIVIAAIIFCYVRKLLCFGVRGNGLSLEDFGKAMSTKEKRLAPPTPQEVAQNRLRIYNATGKIVYSDRELASSLPPYQSNSAANFNRNFNYNRVPMSPNPVSARRLAPGELYANRPVPMPYQSPAAFNQRVQQGQQLRQQQGQQRRQQQQQQIYPTNMYTPTTYAAAPAPTAYPQYAGPANNAAAAAAAYARQFGGVRAPNAQAGEIPAPRGRAPAPGPRGSSRGAAGRAGERSGYVRVRRDGDDGAGDGNARRGDREDAAPGISSSRARPPRGASIGRQPQQPQRRPVQTNTQPDDGPRRVRPPRAAAEAPPSELQPRQQDPVRRPQMQASVAVLQRQPQPRPVPQAQAQPVRNTEEFDVVGAYMSSSAGTERSTFPALAGVPRSASLQRKIGSGGGGGGVAESVKQNAYQGDEQPSAARQRAQRAGAAPAASGQTGRSEPRGDAQPGFRRPTQPTALKPPAPSTPGGPPAMLTPVSSVDSIVGPNTAAREAVPAPGSDVPAVASPPPPPPPTGAAIPLTMLQDPTEFQRAAAKTPISTREATRRQQALEREIAAAVASATVKHASKDLTASDASANSSRRVSTGSGNQGQPGASSMRVDNGRQKKTSNFDAQANRNTAATSVSAVGSLSKEYAWLNESTARSATGGASSVGTSQKSVTGSYDWRGARVYDAAAAIQARNIQGQARNRSRG